MVKVFQLLQEKVEFGYTRKDVIIIGAGLIGAGYALYYGVQAFGIEATAAGNYVQLFVFLVICLGYISTYIFRVANKVRLCQTSPHQIQDPTTLSAIAIALHVRLEATLYLWT